MKSSLPEISTISLLSLRCIFTELIVQVELSILYLHSSCCSLGDPGGEIALLHLPLILEWQLLEHVTPQIFYMNSNLYYIFPYTDKKFFYLR